MDKFEEFKSDIVENENAKDESEKECNDDASISKPPRIRECEDNILPKWEPWNNTCEEQNSHKSNKNRNGMISIAAIVLALIVLAVAVIVFVNISEEIGIKTKTSQTTSMILNSENGIAKLTLTDSKHGNKGSRYVLTDVTGIVEDVLPSVVSVTSRTLVTYYRSSGDLYNRGIDIFNYYFGSNMNRSNNQESAEIPSKNQDVEEIDSGIGSGTIIAQNSTELLILTSYHVVENCSSLYVTFVNEVSVDGYIKSADKEKDIAIVAVPLSDIDKETLGSIKIATISTETAKVGEGVIVIGNALGYGISVTTGIVSAVNREINVDGHSLSVIQTDAAVNSGNSGGCMLNSLGEVIGINEAKVKVSYVEGMGYAIPVACNLELIQNLLNARVPYEKNTEDMDNISTGTGAFLGIRGRDVDDSIQKMYGNLPKGVYVSSVVPESGAYVAGIISGDIIVGIDDAIISTMDELQQILSEHHAGDVIKVVLLREIGDGYQSFTIEVELIDRIS